MITDMFPFLLLFSKEKFVVKSFCVAKMASTAYKNTARHGFLDKYKSISF